MSFVHKLLDWNEKKFDEIDENTNHASPKAFGTGMINGAIDGAVLMYPFLLIACYYWRKKAEGK